MSQDRVIVELEFRRSVAVLFEQCLGPVHAISEAVVADGREIPQQFIGDGESRGRSVIPSADQQITGFAMLGQVVGERADRRARFNSELPYSLSSCVGGAADEA